MVQELISNKRVAIIGGGPAGCICAKFLLDKGFDVTIFEKTSLLRTLLPTGGGRCNLTFNEPDFKLFAKNYPRGEKFLYSMFSRFDASDTIEFFKTIGVETYCQPDNRVFPISNSSKDVRSAIIKAISSCRLEKSKVVNISCLDNGYKVMTDKSKYAFDILVVAIGGHSSFSLLSSLELGIVSPCPALVGLRTKNGFVDISGVSLQNVGCKLGKTVLIGDILFTHKGISGPLIYKISSLLARESLPWNLSLKLVDDFNFQEFLDKNPHKDIKNLLSQFIPKSLSNYILTSLNIPVDLPCHSINGKIRDKIYNKLVNFEIDVVDRFADSEVVTCGGISLKEVNSKTIESKNYKNLYFCGEVLDIDGFCGGFNLQNCWTTGYVVANSIYEKVIAKNQ